MFVRAAYLLIDRKEYQYIQSDTQPSIDPSTIHSVASVTLNTNSNSALRVVQTSRTSIPQSDENFQNEAYFAIIDSFLQRIAKCKFTIEHSFIPNKKVCTNKVLELEEKIYPLSNSIEIKLFEERLARFEDTIKELYKGDLEDIFELLGPDLVHRIFSYLTPREMVALKLSSKMLKTHAEQVEEEKTTIDFRQGDIIDRADKME